MMKPIFLALSLACTIGLSNAQQYDLLNMDLKSNWKDPSFDYSGMDAKYSSIWGWHDKGNDREYAILGGKDGTYFIEVTNPSNAVYRAYVPGRQKNCTWREYKTHGKYAYAISDDLPPNSLQIIDMSGLPNAVNVVHDSDEIFETAHTLYIDKDKLYCAHVRKKDGTYYPMAVYSLANPEKPVFLRSLADDYPAIDMVHDMFVRNDTVFASAGFQGMFIFKLKPDNRFQMLGSITSYNGQGYNHSSWLTPDGKTLVFADEVPEALPAKIADVSDLSDIKITSYFQSNIGATAHNPYIVGDNYLVFAYYQDGVQLYDISNPNNPIRIGYFDTHPQNGNLYPEGTGYNGCWGAYPFLPSGIILASDRQNGLFVIDAGLKLLIQKPKELQFKISPNPFKNKVNVQLPDTTGTAYVKFLDISGRILYSKTENLNGINYFDVKLDPGLTPGIYFLNISNDKFNVTQKLVKQFE